MAVLHFFLVNSPLIYILFSLGTPNMTPGKVYGTSKLEKKIPWKKLAFFWKCAYSKEKIIENDFKCPTFRATITSKNYLQEMGAQNELKPDIVEMCYLSHFQSDSSIFQLHKPASKLQSGNFGTDGLALLGIVSHFSKFSNVISSTATYPLRLLPPSISKITWNLQKSYKDQKLLFIFLYLFAWNCNLTFNKKFISILSVSNESPDSLKFKIFSKGEYSQSRNTLFMLRFRYCYYYHKKTIFL